MLPMTTGNQLISFGFGQAIMLLGVIASILKQYLREGDVYLPTLQSAVVYVLLAVVYLPLKFFFLKSTKKTGVPLWFYALLAIVDVEANYFAVKAFRYYPIAGSYTKYPTVGLLLNFAVPFVFLLCYVFLKTRYRWQHYVGAVVAFGGCVVIFASDYSIGSSRRRSPELRVCIYGVIAAVLYAASYVMIQTVVKTRDMHANVELLAYLGLFASILSIVQILALELSSIQETEFTASVYGYMTLWTVDMFVFYTMVTVFLRRAESLFLSMNLLTGPVFTSIAYIVFFGTSMNSSYWAALVLFFIGFTLYALTPAPEKKCVVEEPCPEEYEDLETPKHVEPTTESTTTHKQPPVAVLAVDNFPGELLLAVRIPYNELEIGEVISQGGFGEVAIATYKNQDVAVKRLLAARRRDPKSIQSFVQEIELNATLEHECLVRFIGAAWDVRDNLCMVSEFVRGGDLRTLLSEHARNGHRHGHDGSKLRTAVQVAQALVYLHTLDPPVVHRDLKSRNVLLTELLDAKLIDFGVSTECLDETMTAGVGTSLWMAPEIMLGKRYDAKADVFSFGVILSELDTHEIPYDHVRDPNSNRKLATALLHRLIYEGKVQPRFTELADPEIVALAKDCLDVDPAKRPTAAQVLDRIRMRSIRSTRRLTGTRRSVPRPSQSSQSSSAADVSVSTGTPQTTGSLYFETRATTQSAGHYSSS